MDYRNDIFISYRRHPETLRWIQEHFLPLLELRVGLALGRDPVIYAHEITGQIPAGTEWPVALGEELGASRTLVALWSGSYLNSAWCVEELGIMLAREEEAGCRTIENKYGLVLPVVIHDGETIPGPLEGAQRLEIKECYNTRMRADSPKAEQLSDQISRHADGLAAAILHAPEFRAEWSRQAARALVESLRAVEASQRTVPRFHRR